MKKLWLLFLLLTALNALLYFFRDDLQYVKYSTYDELYASCDKACQEKWDDFVLAYPETSFTEARKLLRPLRLDTASTLSKIEAIGHHLYAKFHKQAGYPQDIIHKAPPLDAYRILSADTAQKIFCGTYAMLFNFFCWSHHVVCRNVEIYKPGDHHVLNECWVPELNRWLMVDLTSGILTAEAEHRFLNVQDFVKAVAKPGSLFIKTAGTGEQKAFSAVETNGAVKAYYNTAYPYFYYHLTQSSVIYRPVEKLKRYFLPDYWYEIFSPERKSNPIFWAKLFFGALWLILASAIFIKKFIK